MSMGQAQIAYCEMEDYISEHRRDIYSDDEDKLYEDLDNKVKLTEEQAEIDRLNRIKELVYKRDFGTEVEEVPAMKKPSKQDETVARKSGVDKILENLAKSK